MLNYLKNEANVAFTENGAVTNASSLSDCVDLFATIGAIRNESEAEIEERFFRALAEDAETAMKILFYGRDIRGGLGERRVFRVILKWMAEYEPNILRKNIALIPEYGRWDDLLVLMGTACEADALALIRAQLEWDMKAGDHVSLLAKWLPSVNTSNAEAVANAKRIARYLGMSDARYRKTLTELRAKIRIIENNLREQDYTFDYEKQPSKALLKYRKAFLRNDAYRYTDFLCSVDRGEAKMNTGTLMPYEILRSCFGYVSDTERRSLDTTWNALPDYAGDENAIVVMDGSGSMYSYVNPRPIDVAMSLAIYFAERSKGGFHNHFITFSRTPRLVEIQGRDIVEKVRYCSAFNEVADTNLESVFELILRTAVNNNLPQSELPAKIFIISDMEFNYCARNASVSNFENARRRFEAHGYKLPDVVFWNVESRNRQQPVTYNEQGVALVSGCNARLFEQVVGVVTSPYELMMDVIGSERYAAVRV